MGERVDHLLLAALFNRPAVHQAYVLQAPEQVNLIAERLDRIGGRYVANRPKVGPRGGVGNRAKTKAARKANLRRRMQQ